MAISAPIRQALASDALQGHVRAVGIVVTQSRAAVVAEVKLIAIALQMLLTNVVERAALTASPARRTTAKSCGHPNVSAPTGWR